MLFLCSGHWWVSRGHRRRRVLRGGLGLRWGRPDVQHSGSLQNQLGRPWSCWNPRLGCRDPFWSSSRGTGIGFYTIRWLLRHFCFQLYQLYLSSPKSRTANSPPATFSHHDKTRTFHYHSPTAYPQFPETSRCPHPFPREHSKNRHLRGLSSDPRLHPRLAFLAFPWKTLPLHLRRSCKRPCRMHSTHLFTASLSIPPFPQGSWLPRWALQRDAHYLKNFIFPSIVPRRTWSIPTVLGNYFHGSSGDKASYHSSQGTQLYWAISGSSIPSPRRCLGVGDFSQKHYACVHKFPFVLFIVFLLLATVTYLIRRSIEASTYLINWATAHKQLSQKVHPLSYTCFCCITTLFILIVIIPHRQYSAFLYSLAITFYIHPYTYIDNMQFLIPTLTVVWWVAGSLRSINIKGLTTD